MQIMVVLEGARAKGEVSAIQSLQLPSQKGRPGKRKRRARAACWAAAACRHHCATLFCSLLLVGIQDGFSVKASAP